MITEVEVPSHGLLPAVVIRPADTLIIALPVGTSPAQMAEIREELKERLPDIRAVVIAGATQLAVYRPD